MLFLAIALLSGIPLLSIYCLYYFCVLKTKKRREYLDLIDRLLTKSANPVGLHDVTILIPARNEEAAISRKIHNIAELDYDKDKIDVIVVDDDSEDQTCKFALKAFEKYGLRGKIVKNRWSGANASYNTGILKAEGDLILLTDADVTIEKDSLKKASIIITNIKNVGGITGQSKTISDQETNATALDKNYRNFARKMLTAESAIYSTFPGAGGFILLKKEALSPIRVDFGSKDGEIALSILRKGFRYISVPDLVYHEKITDNFNDQIRQKSRRAARLIQSVLLNHDIAFKKEYGQFGKMIFPLRFAMLVMCPILAFIAFSAVLLSFFHLSAILGVSFLSTFCFLLFFGTRTSNPILRFFSSFAFHQFYLMLGLILSPKKMSIWCLRKK